MLQLTIEHGSPVAPFDQVRAQLVDLIASSTLIAGTRLPTVRGLAEQLGIAPNTVAKAYRALENDGFIETNGRNGTVVSAQGDVAEQQAQLAAQAYVARAQQLGVPASAAIEYVRRAFGE